MTADTWDATERDLAAVQAEIKIVQLLTPKEEWPEHLREARAKAIAIHERRIAINMRNAAVVRRLTR